MSRRPPPPPPRRPTRVVGLTRAAWQVDPPNAMAKSRNKTWLVLAAVSALLFALLMAALLALLVVWYMKSADSTSGPNKQVVVEEPPEIAGDENEKERLEKRSQEQQEKGSEENKKGQKGKDSRNGESGGADGNEGKKGGNTGGDGNSGDASGREGESKGDAGKLPDGGRGGQGRGGGGGQEGPDGTASGGKRSGGSGSDEGDSPGRGPDEEGNGRAGSGGNQSGKVGEGDSGEFPRLHGQEPAGGDENGDGDESGNDGEGIDGSDSNGDEERVGRSDPDVHPRPKAEAVGRLLGIEAKGQRIAYVVDCSFGISQDQFDQVCDELARSMATLKKRQRFIVLLYSDDVFRGDPGAPFDDTAWLSPTENNIEFIKSKLVRKRVWGDPDPSLGIIYALDLKPDVVYLLAAGEFGKHAVQDIREANDSKVPIHTISLFDPSLGELLRPIAEQNGGEYRSLK